jgi:hypothetical protein
VRKKTMADRFLETLYGPQPDRLFNAAMRVTDARVFNEDGTQKTELEMVADRQRREREWPSK